MVKESVDGINYMKKLNGESRQYVNERLTSIVILTYNKLEYTQICIESIRNFTDNNKYEIIIIDNNSQDGTVEWLKQQSDLRVIYNSKNLGFPKGCNQGIEIASGDNILLLNNDVIVTPNWLFNLDIALWSEDEIGAVGAVSNNCSYYQQIDVFYKDINEMIEFSIGYNKSDSELWHYRTKLIGFCMLIKKQALNKVGLLDEIFTPGNFEDDDISFRLIREGYKLLLCKDTFVHHFGSVSFGEVKEEYLNIMHNNIKQFENKWGFNPQYSNIIRFELINMINENKEKHLNILEIGCGTGATLLEIKSRYKNSNIYGIEICEALAKISSSISNLIIGNIEELELKYEDKFFDYIILGDVLEHLNNPWETLKNIRKYLKKDGFVIASIPNVMHVSVLKELVKGRFSYKSAGILDKTHLRFFTLKEIQKLFINASYDVKDIRTTSMAISNEEEEFIECMSGLYGKELIEQYKAYQYIIKANKSIDYNRYNSDEMIKLKYYLMRIDNELDVENSMKYILELYYKHSDELIEDIEYLLSTAVVNKETVLNRIAINAFGQKLYDLSISTLMLAFKINKTNIDTVYNLVYILNKLGEYEIALNIFNNSDEVIKVDLGIRELINEGK
ncbi:bifunctional glycosyltransferase family 2 protein/class I SAM-dependent methyltransferase [Clostridioides difficile]